MPSGQFLAIVFAGKPPSVAGQLNSADAQEHIPAIGDAPALRWYWKVAFAPLSLTPDQTNRRFEYRNSITAYTSLRERRATGRRNVARVERDSCSLRRTQKLQTRPTPFLPADVSIDCALEILWGRATLRLQATSEQDEAC